MIKAQKRLLHVRLVWILLISTDCLWKTEFDGWLGACETDRERETLHRSDNTLVTNNNFTIANIRQHQASTLAWILCQLH